MLSTIMGVLINPLLDKLVGPLADCYKAYLTKTITEAQLREQLQALMLGTLQAVEVEHSEALTKTYATFMDAAKTNTLMTTMWAVALGSQIFVLFWSQFVVPLMYAYGYLPNWKAGTSADWSYLLVGALLGLGPMVLRSGPTSGAGIVAYLRSLIGSK